MLNRTGNELWAIGASLLLYLKGIAAGFNDIDIMVAEDDVHCLKEMISTSWADL